MRHNDRKRIAETLRATECQSEPLPEATTYHKQTIAHLNTFRVPTNEAIRRLQLLVDPQIEIESESETLERLLRSANLTYALEVFAIARTRSNREN